jgi:arabinan endo-1,5-alpha-L-arabinosidase
MTNLTTSVDMESYSFTSPEGAPFTFHIRIFPAVPLNPQGHFFEIYGQKCDTPGNQTKTYLLPDKSHTSYLDLFEQLANDFGLRLPQNRKLLQKKEAIIPYHEVLVENLAPGMLYGYGDPAVLRTTKIDKEGNHWYYIVSTSNDAPNSFPIVKSRDLKSWTFVGYVFPEGGKPDWTADGQFISDFWAPEMHEVNDEYRVYFVARARETRELCIGMARSENPEGPFFPDPSPLLRANTIDPHLFKDDDETTYLLWKEDNNEAWPRLLLELIYLNPDMIVRLFPEEEEDQRTASFLQTLWPWAKNLAPMERFLVIQTLIEAVIDTFSIFYDRLGILKEDFRSSIRSDLEKILNHMKTPVYVQPLSPDGSSLRGERIKILENDLEWEAHLVEGMWLTKQEGKYYLFYAGNDFSTNQYGIGVAIADTPSGPFTKVKTPFLQSTDDWWAPGHPSLSYSIDGKPLLFLHAFFPNKAGYKQFRALLSIPIQFKGDHVEILKQ